MILRHVTLETFQGKSRIYQGGMLTKKNQEGGKILGIEILDHLIVAPYKYYSFAEHGVMPL